uniref:Cytochrome P450 Cyp2d14 n=1 Tax=Andrias davidianus TaxID=141262 RepID=A0A1Y9TKP2_ANDDA|nr:cytochrome P450 Cyp2d14 [Andrias davidianus]
MGAMPSTWLPLPVPDNSLTLLGLFFTVFVLLLDLVKRRKKWSRYPPGPTSLPFLGNITQVDFHNLPLCFAQLSKKFGNIFSLQFCWTNVVVLNGFQVIKEALVNASDDLADRPPMPRFEFLGMKQNGQGVLNARYGQAWKDMRRFSLSTLRNFGLGRKSLEERVIEEAGFLCEAFQSEEGHPLNPHYLLNNAVSNVICSITFGNRFEYDDEKFQRLLQLFEEGIRAESGVLHQLLDVIPVLVRIPGVAEKLAAPRYSLMNFMREVVEEHKKSWDPAVRRDFIDALLEEIEKNKGDPTSSFNDSNLLFTTFDIFAAGTETSSTTLRWGLLFMALYPAIQSKVHEEIDCLIGRGRRPNMEDMESLDFTKAVIHEIQRRADVLPVLPPHMAYRDTEIQGSFIPKGTTILINLSSVLHDETIWERPDQFYPEHFLDADGKFSSREAFMPFSAGRRVCLGEKLARMELFLFFTSLLQCFTFTIPKDHPRPREDAAALIVKCPYPYQLCAKVR